MFLISGPSLLYVFKKWSEFTLKVVRVYLKSGPSLPGPNLPGPNLLVFFIITFDYVVRKSIEENKKYKSNTINEVEDIQQLTLQTHNMLMIL